MGAGGKSGCVIQLWREHTAVVTQLTSIIWLSSKLESAGWLLVLHFLCVTQSSVWFLSFQRWKSLHKNQPFMEIAIEPFFLVLFQWGWTTTTNHSHEGKFLSIFAHLTAPESVSVEPEGVTCSVRVACFTPEVVQRASYHRRRRRAAAVKTKGSGFHENREVALWLVWTCCNQLELRCHLTRKLFNTDAVATHLCPRCVCLMVWEASCIAEMPPSVPLCFQVFPETQYNRCKIPLELSPKQIFDPNDLYQCKLTLQYTCLQITWNVPLWILCLLYKSNGI